MFRPLQPYVETRHSKGEFVAVSLGHGSIGRRWLRLLAAAIVGVGIGVATFSPGPAVVIALIVFGLAELRASAWNQNRPTRRDRRERPWIYPE
jgi:hypothetical protein